MARKCAKPSYKAIKKKAEALKGVPSNYLRCVFLVDAGCDLLRRLRPIGGGREVSGERIVRHALAKLRVDVVSVFSPQREAPRFLGGERQRYWQATCFDRRAGLPSSEYAGLHNIAEVLPPPRYEGYQARSFHEQGMFDPEMPLLHLPTICTTSVRHTDVTTTLKVSARLTQELLAGRMTRDEFQASAFPGHPNRFEEELRRGRTIRSVGFEAGGLDQDDDYVVFVFAFDPSMLPLTSRTK